MASQRPKATKQEGDSKASVKNPGSSPGEPTSTESSENTQTSLPVSAVPANPKSEDVWQDLKTDAETQSGSVELSYGELPKRKPKLKSASGKLPKSSKPNADGKKAEDVIEDGILSAFDAIEIFFDTYGSPVAASASNRSGGQSTGSIEFVNGTSELSERSKNYLHSLAPQLGKMYKDGQLEIRAQSNEKADSPAHRFLLTQSRAEAVRDELSDSGFPANRLVPIGSETAGETRVKFVHRPN
ncbi:MAG: hypothetical protein KDB65_05195 [Calditrichaeota bacterium]|nr:hypothetical protein [Calditrichota bacterium]MCB9368288.1 hypothetical protein [Calditrichota bacterium]